MQNTLCPSLHPVLASSSLLGATASRLPGSHALRRLLPDKRLRVNPIGMLSAAPSTERAMARGHGRQLAMYSPEGR